jgi:hypothetical protein
MIMICFYFISSVDAGHALANLRHTRWGKELVHGLYYYIVMHDGEVGGGVSGTCQ